MQLLNDMNTSFERGNNRTDEWYTPKWMIDALGKFDLDPCAPSVDFYTAEKCYTKEIDGLSQKWGGVERVWLNPPYKNPLIGKFVKRLVEHGNGIALIFNRMDTKLWHDTIFPNATAMLILRGRLTFESPDSTKPNSGAGCGSVLVAFGEDNAECLRTCNIDGKFIRLQI